MSLFKNWFFQNCWLKIRRAKESKIKILTENGTKVANLVDEWNLEKENFHKTLVNNKEGNKAHAKILI